jgi:hypothetical protein
MPDQAFNNTFCIIAARMNDQQRNASIQYLKDHSYTMAHVCPMIDGKFPDVQAMRMWLQKVRAAGLATCLWFMKGNSGDESGRSEDAFNEVIKQNIDSFGDLADAYCIGIEVDEYKWGADRVARHCDFVRKTGGKKVAVHTAAREASAYFGGADIAFLQYGFGTNAGDVAAYTKQIIAKFPGKAVVAMEYAKNGDSDAARALGEAAMNAGAIGFGNGGTTVAISLARQRAIATQTGAPPVPGPPATEPIDASLPRGFYKHGSLPALDKMQVVQAVRSAHVDSKNVTLDYDGRPVGDPAHFAFAWQENAAWFWCDFEWCLNGAKSHNWSDNLVAPPGICTEPNGTQHTPRSGIRVYAFLCDKDLKTRTNIVDAGVVP